MKNSDRWRNMKEEGVSDDEIKKSFKKKVQMRVFAWNANREKDTVMTPLDSIKYHREMLQTAFMVMDPLTGQVKAWVGGIDFKNYKYDHVNIKTKRQVGSSIKPFLFAGTHPDPGKYCATASHCVSGVNPNSSIASAYKNGFMEDPTCRFVFILTWSYL